MNAMPDRVTRRDLAPAVTAQPPVDPALPRAAVIGAGSSGLAAAKTLHLAGIPVDCFEQGPVQSEEIREALRSGNLTPHRGIRRLAKDRVHSLDGTSAPAAPCGAAVATGAGVLATEPARSHDDATRRLRAAARAGGT